MKKRLEHTLKSMVHDGNTISVHRPDFYAKRFTEFMGKTVFQKIPSREYGCRGVVGFVASPAPQLRFRHRPAPQLSSARCASRCAAPPLCLLPPSLRSDRERRGGVVAP